MGLLLKAAEKRSFVFNPLHPRDPGLDALFGYGNESAAGIAVNPTTASGEDTFFAAERYLSETIAALPLGLYRRLDPRGREKATDHWLYSRLHNRPNRYMAKFRFWRLLLNWLFYRGNFYILIQPSTVLAPFEFWPLHPDRIQLRWENDVPYYEYTTPKNGVKRLRFGEVMSVSFLPGEDGFTGRSVLSYQINTIGRALAAERYQSKLSANNSNPSGVLKVKKTLTPDATKRMRNDWRETYGGENAGGVAILQEDMDFATVTMTNDDAQAVEMLQLNSESMARIARVPQHKVGLLERATFSNIEHQAIEAVQDSILPIAVNIEDEIWFHLIPERDQDKLYAKFTLEGLLRGDFLSRQQGLEIMRRNAVIDGNDWAEVEDRNPFSGGDKRFVPLQWVDIDEPRPVAPPPAIRLTPEPRETRSLVLLTRLRSAYLAVIEDAARRVLRREADSIERQFRRHAQERSLSEFLTWLTGYHDELREAISQTMTPAIGNYIEVVGLGAAGMVGGEAAELGEFTRGYMAALAARHVNDSRAAIVSLIADTEPAEQITALDALLHAWRTERGEAIARREVVRAAGAVSRHVWHDAGIASVRWARGGDCADCEPFSGATVGIRDAFDGETWEPPLHDGCTCGLVPGGMQ